MTRLPSIITLTLMRSEGSTGVQSHFNAFEAYLKALGGEHVLVTPFQAPRGLLYPAIGLRRLVEPVWPTIGVWWYRTGHAWLLRRQLHKILARYTAGARSPVLYAQCPVSARVALQVRGSRRIPIVLIVHFNESQADEWAAKGKIAAHGALFNSIRKLEESILPAMDGIVFVSRFTRTKLTERIPALARVTQEIVPNFCDDAQDGSIEGDWPRVDLVNVGSLEPRKNQHFLLRVLAAAAALGRCYSLLLVGDGPDRERLESLAGELGVRAQVHFAGYRKQARCLMKLAKVYVHSALNETFGIVLIEAMATGLPCVAFKVGGVPEVLRDSVEGFFWPSQDPRQCAEALIALLEDSALYSRYAASAQVRFETAFRTDRVADKLAGFLERISSSVDAMNGDLSRP